MFIFSVLRQKLNNLQQANNFDVNAIMISLNDNWMSTSNKTCKMLVIVNSASLIYTWYVSLKLCQKELCSPV